MAESSMLGSSVSAFRAAFGDRKPPEISRKITACVACRKLKVKCHMPDEGPPCERCEKRDLSCTVNRSLQQVLESDLSWKDSIEQRLVLLERTVAQLSGHEHEQERVDTLSQENTGTHNEVIEPQHGGTSDEQHGWEVIVDDSHVSAAVPASYISEIAVPTPSKLFLNGHRRRPDMIACNILHARSATTLFELYRDRLDQFLYGILSTARPMSEVRLSSPLLTDAICTVAALHSKSENYPACRAAFMQQVSTQMFSKRKTSDDVRGLCIAAFWLSDISWSLIGLAVCIANEIKLNYAFVHPNYASREWYLDARLYLLVHVCERHLSIVYGRAPMSETFHDLSFVKDFSESIHACEDDRKLVSQLELWSINYRTYKTFGLDTEGALPRTYMADFRRISIALDTWRVDWEERFISNSHTDGSMQQGIGLHFDFAKLYLCSHAYRGLLNGQSSQLHLDVGLEEFAAKAISAAESILHTTNTDSYVRRKLGDLPIYFNTMIAFAVVFLLKAISRPQQGLRINKQSILELLEQTSQLLAEATDTMRREHILRGIALSTQKLIQKASAVTLTNMQRHPLPVSGTNVPGTASLG